MNARLQAVDGFRLRAIRKRAGMSLSDLAEAMGLTRSSQTALGRIEREQKRAKLSTAQRIADALGVPLEDISRLGDATVPWPMHVPLGQRIAEKITVDANGCWIWQGRINGSGYGELKCGDRRLKAHRLSYEHHVGPIPDGLEIDHLCRVRPCVNPEHLEPVTKRENQRRSLSFAAKNAAKTHCPRGHEYDEANTYMTKKGQRNCRACAKQFAGSRRTAA